MDDRDRLIAACAEQKTLRAEYDAKYVAVEEPADRDGILAEYNRKQAALDFEVQRLAVSLPARPGDHATELVVVGVREFANLGVGAEFAARSKAQLVAKEAAEHPAIICTVHTLYYEGPDPRMAQHAPGKSPIGFRAVAHVQDESDAWVLRLDGKWGVEEFVRQCWLIGVNPRAYVPDLPFDFEALNGITFDGGHDDKD